MVMQHMIIHALVFALVVNGYLLLMMLFTSPRVWGYSDYPAVVRDKVPPQTGGEKAAAVILALPWMAFVLGFPVYSTLALRSSLGGSIPLLTAILNPLLLFLLANLSEVLLLDWLLVSKITPGFVVIPGTSARDYKDMSHHFKGHLRAAGVMVVLSVVIGAAAAFAAAPAQVTAQERPNVVLIMADDLGYETVGADGGTSYSTPNLDALAAGGMRFTQAYATPLCTPSRVQLMTGKYGFRNYIGFGLLDPGERTFGHLLREAGYRTGVFGKWQLYGNARQRELAGGRGGSLPRQAGFDDYALWQVEQFGWRYKEPLLEVAGEPTRTYEGSYGPDEIIGHVERFIERHRDEPFFVYYPMILPHSPFQATPDDADYAASEPRTQSDPARYAGHVAYVDKLVGRLVDKLEQLGLRDNTLVLFIGDNGTPRAISSMLGEREIRGQKGYTTAAGTHVPMIASWPGTIAAGRVNDNLVDFTDFLPTLVEVAQAPLPEGFISDGLSFLPQLLGRDAPVRSWVFCHYAPNWNNLPHRRFVHDRDWKLYEDGSFYDVSKDPGEERPVAEADLTDEARALKRRFEAVLERMTPGSTGMGTVNR